MGFLISLEPGNHWTKSQSLSHSPEKYCYPWLVTLILKRIPCVGSTVAADISLNSLAPGRFERNLRKVLFKLILMIGGLGIFCKIALRWMSTDLIDDKSTLVQVMAWCHQATSHYLNLCWPRSVSPYGVTRPQWVKSYSLDLCYVIVLIKSYKPHPVGNWHPF